MLAIKSSHPLTKLLRYSSLATCNETNHACNHLNTSHYKVPKVKHTCHMQ